MAFTDIYFPAPNNNQHSNYYVVDQNTYPASSMHNTPTQIVFINHPYQSQNQDCNVYNYYPNNNSSNSSTIQQRNESVTYGNSKESQAFYPSPPVKEFVNNYQPPTSHSNILVHESSASSASSSEVYSFQTTVNNPPYPIMTPSPQPSEYHSSYTHGAEKNGLFIIHPMQSTPSNSASSFSSDESSVYLFDSVNDSSKHRRMHVMKSDKKRKSSSPISEKKHLCPYCEHR